MSLNSLLQSPDASQRTVVKEHVAKWEKTGLLEGLGNETDKAGMATLLENQARQLVKEATATGTAAGSEEWAGVALPLVRRIFAEFAAKEFVSVQPMNLPSGLIFYLDFKYGTAVAGFDDDNSNRGGDPFGSTNADDSLFGATSVAGDPTGGLYGAGRFGYSIKATTAEDVGNTVAAITSASVNFDSEITSLSDFATAFHTVTVATSSLSGSIDAEAVRGFTIASSSAGKFAATFPAFTKISGANVVFVISGSATNQTQNSESRS